MVAVLRLDKERQGVEPSYHVHCAGLTPFAERHRLVDPEGEDGVRVGRELKRIGDRLLQHARYTINSRVQYVLADDNQANAYATMVGPDEAAVVLSRGLIKDLLQNESQLAFVIAHELRHIWFSEQYRQPGNENPLPVTKVEEYFADVGGMAELLEEAGYAPGEGQVVLDRLAALDQIPQLLRPWVADKDVHGLGPNRSEAYGKALAQITRERGRYRRLDEVPEEMGEIPLDLQEAAVFAKHQSHITRLVTGNEYCAALPEVKFELLVNEVGAVDRKTVAARQDELVCALRVLVKELKPTTEHAERLFAAVCKSGAIEVVALIEQLSPERLASGGRLLLPKALYELRQALIDFVGASDAVKLLAASKKLTLLREAFGGVPINAGKLGVNGFIQPKSWGEHLRRARSFLEDYAPGSAAHQVGENILRNLFWCGVFDVAAVKGSLVNEAKELSRIKTVLISPHGYERECFAEAFREELRRREEQAVIEHFEGTQTEGQHSVPSLVNLRPEQFVGRFYSIISRHRELLLERRIARVDETGFSKYDSVTVTSAGSTLNEREILNADSLAEDDPFDSETYHPDLIAKEEEANHFAAARKLGDLFSQIEKLQDRSLSVQGKKLIQDFFTADHGLSFKRLIGSTGITAKMGITHPISQYILESKFLSAAEKVELTLPIESNLSEQSLSLLYFGKSSPKKLETRLAKLKEIGEFNEGAQHLARQAVVRELTVKAPGSIDLLSLMARYSTFFGSMRKLEAKELRIVMAHIERLPDVSVLNVSDSIAVFRALESGRLFPPDESGQSSVLRIDLRRRITEQLKSEDFLRLTAAERIQILEMILLSDAGEREKLFQIDAAGTRGDRLEREAAELTKNARLKRLANQSGALTTIQDTYLREVAVEIWAETQRELLTSAMVAQGAAAHSTYVARGLDDGSGAYDRVAEPFLEGIIATLRKRSSVHERIALLGKLASHLELQNTLAQKLRTGTYENSAEQIHDAHAYLKRAEVALEFLSQHQVRRHATVEFLAHALKPEHIVPFVHAIDIFRERDLFAVDRGVEKIVLQRHQELQAASKMLVYLRKVCAAREKLMQYCDNFGGSPAWQSGYTNNDGRGWMIISSELKNECGAFAHLDEYSVVEAILQNEVALAMGQSKGFEKSCCKALDTFLRENPSDENRLQVAEDKEAIPRLAEIVLRELFSIKQDLEREQKLLISLLDAGQIPCTSELMPMTQAFLGMSAGEALKLENGPPCISELIAVLSEKCVDIQDQILQAEQSTARWLIRYGSDGIDLYQRFGPPDGEDFESYEAMAKRALQSYQEITGLDKLTDGLGNEFADSLKAILKNGVAFEALAKSITRFPIDGGLCIGQNETGGVDESTITLLNASITDARREILPYASLREQQFARELYEVFWSRDLLTRTVLLEQLLITPEEHYQDRVTRAARNFEDAFSFVVTKVFPPVLQYGVEAQKILKVFLEETEANSRSFILAALMAAAEKIDASTEEVTAGRRLAMILSMLGPAEKKLAQAINSHPQTPEDLRADTKDVKGMTDPLLRWDLTARYMQIVPESYRKTAIPRIGKDNGSASYYVTAECEDTVLSMLRPYAVRLAESGLGRMARVAERMADEETLAHIAEPFIESIKQAREMITTETSKTAGIAQTEIASKRYSGMRVVVSEEGESLIVDVATAEWRACGDEFRHQQRFEGAHFLDLPESTTRERSFKRQVAGTHLTLELMQLLSGKEFDHDRHGMQLRIRHLPDGRVVMGLFDHGCMATNPLSDLEKREIAAMVTELLEKLHLGESGLLAHAHQRIRDAREASGGTTPHHLVSVERALLALNDFMGIGADGKSRFFSKEDFSQMLAGAVSFGEVDPIYVDAMVNHFGTSAQRKQYSAARAVPFLRDHAVKSACQAFAEQLRAGNQSTLHFKLSRDQGRKEHPKIKVF